MLTLRALARMRLGILFLSVWFIPVWVLTACTAPAPRPADAELEQRWAAHSRRLQQISFWELRARFAVRTEAQGGQATLLWQRTPEQQRIELQGPLGRGMVRVTQDAQGARLLDAEQREFTAANAEALLWQYTGWRLPVSNLEWWVRGLPVPELGSTQTLDASGRLQMLRQQGWDITYSRYTPVAGTTLPGYITLARVASAPEPAMELRFVIERWTGVK